jgi:cytochrome bd ubiquinol oxidase subunit II
MHGSVYAALKVDEPMSLRATSLARTAALIYIVAFVAAGVWVAALPGQEVVSADTLGPSNPLNKEVAVAPGAWLANYRTHALLWLAPVAALLGALGTWGLLGARRPGMAFITSAVTLAGTILTAGFALFPFLMPSSTHPSQGLTIWDASSSQRTLLIMVSAVVVFLPAVILYTAWVFRVLRGRITLEDTRRHTGFY